MHELVTVVYSNASRDWDKQEHVVVDLRRYIRCLFTKYKFPLDKAASAIRLVMAHFELFEAEVAG